VSFSFTQAPSVKEYHTRINSTVLLFHAKSGLLKPYLSLKYFDQNPASLQTIIFFNERPERGKIPSSVFVIYFKVSVRKIFFLS
jgi:hypothetical protein